MEQALLQLGQQQGQVLETIRALVARVDAVERNAPTQGAEQPGPSWDEFRETASKAASQKGMQLAQLFENAPGTEIAEDIEETGPKYEGVPKAATATRKMEDRKVTKIQKAFEAIMHRVVHCYEKPEEVQTMIEEMAAISRRGWEEANNLQRRMFVVGAFHVLEREEDEQRLLSSEEERRQRASRGRGRVRGPFRQGRGRWQSPSPGRGQVQPWNPGRGGSRGRGARRRRSF